LRTSADLPALQPDEQERGAAGEPVGLDGWPGARGDGQPIRPGERQALGWIAPAGFGAGGATLAVLLVRRYAPEAAGSGIPHTKAVLYRLRDLPWQRVLPIKLVGGALALGSGLALGREGSTVQMGGAVGAAVAARLKSPIRERLTLIAAGAGAGLAAAFNAPLAGLVFVLEELQRDFRPGVFGAAFIAAAVADILARLVGGQLPVFAVPSYPVAPLAALPIFAALGALAGLLGILFNHGLLVIGALIGLGVGETAHALAPGVVPIPAAFAVVGMAAYFTAIVRAPLTGIVLIVEMTGNYNQMLPLLVACFAAYLVAEGLRQLPIYEALLQRDRQHSSHAHTFHEPTVLELTIEPGAPFVGRPIRDLGLPPGCIMVCCRDGAREWIPTADTRLDAHMQCTFVIAPEVAPALRLLREGCEAPV
jgi:H+/Cl- antiporter ClcA